MRGHACLVAAVLLLAAAPAAAQARLGILALDLSTESSARVARAAEIAALDKGWEIELHNAAGDLAAHAQRLEALVEQQVDGILLVLSRAAELESQLGAAQGGGIPVVSVMSGISPFTAFDVTVNEFEVGAKIGMYLMGALRFEGDLLMQRADAKPDTRARARVMDAILDENEGVRLQGAVTADPSQLPPDELRRRLDAWLAGRVAGTEGIWTAVETQAFVTDDILRAAGGERGSLVLTTVGSGQEVFRRLRDPASLLTATVAIPYELLGEASIDALDDLIAGTPKEQITAGPQLFIDTVVVDRSNVPPEEAWPW